MAVVARVGGVPAKQLGREGGHAGWTGSQVGRILFGCVTGLAVQADPWDLTWHFCFEKKGSMWQRQHPD